jgi:hypothetical protein
MLCAMALADATVIFPKADVEHLMERIVHAPVFSHRLGETDGITGQRGQEQSLLDRDLTTHVAVGLDKAHTGNLGPRALHAYALDIRRDPLVACFQATMIDVSGGMTLRGWRAARLPPAPLRPGVRWQHGCGSSPAIPPASAGHLACEPVDRRAVGREGHDRLQGQRQAVAGAEWRVLYVQVIRQN